MEEKKVIPNISLFYTQDPADAIKGKTWGPSSVQKDRRQRTSVILSDGRWSKSAPSLQKNLRHLGGGHSNFSALQEMCKIIYCKNSKYWEGQV